MQESPAEHTLRWNDQVLKFTEDDARSFYIILAKMLEELKGKIFFSTEKHNVYPKGLRHRFTANEAQSFGKVLGKFLATTTGSVPIIWKVPAKVQRSDITKICEPLDVSPQTIGRVWSVLCTESLKHPDIPVWCIRCDTTTDKCMPAEDETYEFHLSPQNYRQLELPLSSVLLYHSAFDESTAKIASARVKEVIRIIFNSIENAVA